MHWITLFIFKLINQFPAELPADYCSIAIFLTKFPAVFPAEIPARKFTGTHLRTGELLKT